MTSNTTFLGPVSVVSRHRADGRVEILAVRDLGGLACPKEGRPGFMAGLVGFDSDEAMQKDIRRREKAGDKN
jgi:hypothetical protein